jgi:hypothetical protein
MPANLDVYRQTLIDLYLRLPDTPHRVRESELAAAARQKTTERNSHAR